jgi:hypothetical protein
LLILCKSKQKEYYFGRENKALDLFNCLISSEIIGDAGGGEVSYDQETLFLSVLQPARQQCRVIM